MKFTPEKAIEFTKKSVALMVSWPPPVNTSKTKLFLLDAYFIMSFLNSQSSLLMLINGMYTYRDDPEILIQSTCTGAAIIQMSVKMIASRTKRSNLQSIIVEMENVLKEALPYEREILDKYVDKCVILHVILTFGFYLGSIVVLLGPVFLPQPLPAFAVYPFDVDYHPVYEMVYLQQAFTGFQAAAAASIDCQVAILLWFASARFEMLKVKLEKIVDKYDLRQCIIQHNHILRYAENVVETARFVILATVGVTTMLIVFSGVLLLFTDTVMIKIQFIIVDMVSIIQLLVNSYPAENLLEMSYAVGVAAYDSNWIGKSQNMWRTICILIQRSQKPVKISVGGFLPSLSLAYYMSFLSSSFSYFTTMRAAFQ